MGVGLMVGTLLIALMQGAFCVTWNVELPQRIVGITDSCITIPCHYNVPVEHEAQLVSCSNSGIWRQEKVHGPIVYSALDHKLTILQGQIIGNLTAKNCTTVFYSFPQNYSNMFFFRLDCPATVIQYSFREGVRISSVSDSFPPRLTSVSQVSEGTQVRLQCSVPVPCHILHPSLIWLPQDNSRQEQTQVLQNKDGQMTMTSTLTFTASARHHNQNISCSVSYPLTEGGSTKPRAETQRLDVLYAPRFTVATLSTPGPVSEGCTVTLRCSSDANPPVSRYIWYRDDNANVTKKSEGEVLVMQVSQRDSGAYLCEAQTMRGSQKSRPVSLEVSAAAGSRETVLLFPYILCGVVLVVYILTLAVAAHKYQSLSRRLKQIELKSEHTYTDLRTYSVASDYDELQPKKPKTTSTPEAHNYENPIAMQAALRNQQQPK